MKCPRGEKVDIFSHRKRINIWIWATMTHQHYLEINSFWFSTITFLGWMELRSPTWTTMINHIITSISPITTTSKVNTSVLTSGPPERMTPRQNWLQYWIFKIVWSPWIVLNIEENNLLSRSLYVHIKTLFKTQNFSPTLLQGTPEIQLT